MAKIANLENAVVLDVDAVRRDCLVDCASLVDVVETHCDLQKTIHCSFRVQILILVREETLANPVP